MDGQKKWFSKLQTVDDKQYFIFQRKFDLILTKKTAVSYMYQWIEAVLLWSKSSH